MNMFINCCKSWGMNGLEAWGFGEKGSPVERQNVAPPTEKED
jgi:hypothetical protein